MGKTLQAQSSSRLHERHETQYEAAVRVHPDHAEQFRLSFPDALSDFRVVDVSKGGLGLRSSIYFPKNLRLILNVHESAAADEGESTSLTIRAVVRRCSLLDHKPTYTVGLQFVDAAGADEQHLVKAAAQSKPAATEVVLTTTGAGGGSGD